MMMNNIQLTALPTIQLDKRDLCWLNVTIYSNNTTVNPQNIETMVVEIARGNYYRAEKKTELTLARVGEGYGGGLKGSETILKYKKNSTRTGKKPYMLVDTGK